MSRNGLELELLDALRPTIVEIVREEVERARLDWRWRTPEQLGDLLGVTAAAIRERCRRSQLPALKDETGHWLIDLEEYDRRLRRLP